MRGIIFKTKQEFDYWNNAVTKEMQDNGQIMQQWCSPIINGITGEYFGDCEAVGLRAEIIKNVNKQLGLETTEINEDDENWFPKTDNFLI